ncbi:MAG TPA: acetate--CoA ligase family protein [Alphaproteobacteria bacterium]|nr:acetate--CoA ligase family protein [Alphaproteobacteria bacterium]
MTAALRPRLSVKEILYPSSVAVFGASDNLDKFGGRIIHFLTRHGFQGRIAPINPRRREVLGRNAFASIGQAGAVDVAMLAVPPEALLQSLAECAEAGVGAAVILTTGFAEASAEGAARQAEIARLASTSGMRVIGPNCMGIINPTWHMALCSSVVLHAEKLLVGHIGLISQSGALMVSLFDRAYGDGIGFSACVSLGNQCDLEICDFLEYMIEDVHTRVICLYVEGFADPARFVAAARTCRRAGKPLVLLKTGRTAAGVKAARSHTASLAGSYAALEAVAREAGVVLAEDAEVMVRLADLLVRWPQVEGDGVGVISGSGGGAGILVDRLTECGQRLATLAPGTKAALADILLPPQADNPIDLGGRKLPEAEEISARAMAALAADGDVAALFIVLSSMPFFEARTRLLAATGMASGKPTICSVLPGPAAAGPRRALREADCPVFESTEDAVRTLGKFFDYQRLRARPLEPPPARPVGVPADLGRGPDAGDIKALLARYGIPLAREVEAPDLDGALDAARQIGYPVALKGIASGLVHKSDVGAVRTALSGEAALVAAWCEIEGNIARHLPASIFSGCAVQEMVTGEAELIVGAKYDEQFGPFVLVGFGGVLVELARDVKLAPAPLSHAAALELLRSLRYAPVFAGWRGRPPLDIEKAADVVVRMGWLAADLGARLVDAEINPLILRRAGEGAVAVDVRATIR